MARLFLFPACLVFFTAKLVDPVSVGTHKRVLVIHVTYKVRALEKVQRMPLGMPCLPQPWRRAAAFRFTACSHQSGIKLSCLVPFSHRRVMLRLASSLQRNSRNGHNQDDSESAFSIFSKSLASWFFSAPGSHIYLSPSLPLISKFSRHPSGMEGENFIKHLVCDSASPSGVSNRPLEPSASSCLPSHLTTNLDVCSCFWKIDRCHLTGCCMPVQRSLFVGRYVAHWGGNYVCVVLATSPVLLVCLLAYPMSRRVALDIPHLSAAAVSWCFFL